MTWDQVIVAGAAAFGVVSVAATLHARATMSSVESRVAVLEAQWKEMRSQLSEVRADVKELLRRVK